VLDLISYNIEWGKRLDEAGDWLMSLSPKPDIICLQEMPQGKIPSFKKRLDQHGYNYKYAPSYTKGDTTYGELTAYDKEKLALDFATIVDLGSSIIARLISRHNSKYTSLLTVFKHERKNFIVINIHLLPHALNARRRKQLGIAIEALQLLKYVNMPSLIVGDYNYSSLIGRAGLIRFMAKHGFAIGQKKKLITHRKWRIRHQTDYVFSRNCKIESIKSAKIRFSDHYPMFVKFEV
jgi:endonuclease/exonuclease/phosphatase family metal-dependent hydrolase